MVTPGAAGGDVGRIVYDDGLDPGPLRNSLQKDDEQQDRHGGDHDAEDDVAVHGSTSLQNTQKEEQDDRMNRSSPLPMNIV